MDYRFNMPTEIHFGIDKLEQLPAIAKKHGEKCVLVTTENAPPLQGLYDRVKSILNSGGIEVVHFDQVKPNPTTEIVEAGIQMIQNNKVDFILAVGGGSSMDTAKIIGLLNDIEKPDWNHIFSNFKFCICIGNIKCSI